MSSIRKLGNGGIDVRDSMTVNNCAQLHGIDGGALREHLRSLVRSRVILNLTVHDGFTDLYLVPFQAQVDHEGRWAIAVDAVRSGTKRKSAEKAFDVAVDVLKSATEAVSLLHALYLRAIIKFISYYFIESRRSGAYGRALEGVVRRDACQ